MSPMELASPLIPRLSDQPVWISETTAEEVQKLQQLKDNGRSDELRNSSKKRKNKLKVGNKQESKSSSMLDASSQSRTLTLDPPRTAVNPQKPAEEDMDQFLPPPETFADWYRPTYQAFKALRLFQLSRKPSWSGGGHSPVNLLSTFFASHQPLSNFFLPTSLFSSRHTSSTPTRYIPPIYRALCLPVFDRDPSSFFDGSAPVLPPESQEKLEHKVFLGGFPTFFSVGELRMWLVKRNLTVGEWADVIRVVPTRPEEKRDGPAVWVKRPEGSRKAREMDEWEGKRWWESSGRVGLEKLSQTSSWQPARFLVTVPTEADAHRIVRVLDRATFIPPRINGVTIRAQDEFILEARVVPTE